MGFTISIEDFQGEKVDVFPTELRLSEELLYQNEEFVLLKYLDPYDDTYFNRRMLPDLISDLQILSEQVIDKRNDIQELIDFIERHQGNIHSYVKFEGD